MRNPGVPSPTGHGIPMEVDATMGNPGVPAEGHGIPYQMMPGGSPSATKIEGVGRLGHEAGPYELGHDER